MSRIEADSVYNSDQGRLCPRCSRSISRCQCPKKGKNDKPRPTTPEDGIVRIGRETKGRKGKGVTLVTGISLPEPELKSLAKELKQKCGTGGTVRNGIIEIQGDRRDQLLELLEEKGFRVKKAGG